VRVVLPTPPLPEQIRMERLPEVVTARSVVEAG